jgi:hypothetical protein
VATRQQRKSTGSFVSTCPRECACGTLPKLNAIKSPTISTAGLATGSASQRHHDAPGIGIDWGEEAIALSRVSASDLQRHIAATVAATSEHVSHSGLGARQLLRFARAA